MDFNGILNSRGFWKFHECSCSGTKEMRYRRKSACGRFYDKKVEFRVFPARQSIDVRVSGRVVTRAALSQLENELNKY